MLEPTTTLDKLQPLLHYLYQYPHRGGLITFFMAFLESLAVVGSIIPGSLTMTAIGMLIGTGVLPIVATLVWAIVGAMAGDYLSYWVGARYQNHLKELWPLRRYQHWLEAGEQFLHHHGGKSIIIGRFFGPMRSMIPMIAGMLKMKRSHFIVAMIPSAALWAIVYLSPGFLLGALSIQLPATLATKFLLIALLISAAVWLVAWIIEYSFHKLSDWVDQHSKRLWAWLSAHPTYCAITRWLTPLERKDSASQLARLNFLIVMLIALVFTLISIHHHGWVTAPNKALYYLLKSIQTPVTYKIMITVTALANKYVLATTTTITALWLYFNNHKRTACYFIALFILTAATTYGLKLLIQFPRPGYFGEYSFPSGHTALFVSFIGFLSVLINRSLPPYRRHTVYYITSLAVTIVMVSRLYLGVHWLSDVLGGLLVGITCILLLVLLYRRQDTQPIRPVSLAVVALLALALSFSIHISRHFTSLYSTPKLTPLQQTVTLKQWWLYQKTPLPNYRLNRFGNPAQLFNVQWLGKLDLIKNTLSKQGWESKLVSANFHNFLIRLSQKHRESGLPLLPLKYGNQAPDLLMVKTIHQGNHNNHEEKLILRLWHSNIQVFVKEKAPGKPTPTGGPIWIGTVNQYTPLPHHHHKLQQLKKRLPTAALNPIALLKQDLKPQYTTKLIAIPLSEQTTFPPAHIEGDTRFGRTILLIK